MKSLELVERMLQRAEAGKNARAGYVAVPMQKTLRYSDIKGGMNMKYGKNTQKIVDLCNKLRFSQGFYGRLYCSIMELGQEDLDDLESSLPDFES